MSERGRWERGFLGSTKRERTLLGSVDYTRLTLVKRDCHPKSVCPCVCPCATKSRKKVEFIRCIGCLIFQGYPNGYPRGLEVLVCARTWQLRRWHAVVTHFMEAAYMSEFLRFFFFSKAEISVCSHLIAARCSMFDESCSMRGLRGFSIAKGTLASKHGVP